MFLGRVAACNPSHCAVANGMAQWDAPLGGLCSVACSMTEKNIAVRLTGSGTCRQNWYGLQ